MSLSVIEVWDATLPGDRVHSGTLELDSSTTTLRELIRVRVAEDLRTFRASPSSRQAPLVQLEESEILLNGQKSERPLDEETQVQRACASFKKNGYLVFVNGRQICDLDETIDLLESPAGQPEVEFLKLIPLIGG
jgi:hypothetical protein